MGYTATAPARLMLTEIFYLPLQADEDLEFLELLK
jgi:hypothetical protein